MDCSTPGFPVLQNLSDLTQTHAHWGFPVGLDGKVSTCNAGDRRRPGFDSWVGKIPWRMEFQPTPISCLENPMDRKAWQATVHEVAKSQTRLSDKNMFFESVMPSNHLICHPLLLLPSIFPSIRVFSKKSAVCIRWPKD